MGKFNKQIMSCIKHGFKHDGLHLRLVQTKVGGYLIPTASAFDFHIPIQGGVVLKLWAPITHSLDAPSAYTTINHIAHTHHHTRHPNAYQRMAMVTCKGAILLD